MAKQRGMDKDQLRELINGVLHEMGPKYHSESAVELLMMTAAQESHLGRYIKQIKGPAVGIFQMEPNTEIDLQENYIRYSEDRQTLYEKFNMFGSTGYAGWILPHKYNLLANIPYQIMMARLHYRRFKDPIPAKDDIYGLAKLYKKLYNTPKGKATVEEAVENYKKYCL